MPRMLYFAQSWRPPPPPLPHPQPKSAPRCCISNISLPKEDS